MPSESSRRRVLGCMTGTSMDALDVAIVRIDGRAFGMVVRVDDFRSFDMPVDLRSDLRRCAMQAPLTAGELADLARRFGEFHAHALSDFVDDPETIDLVCVHGQTVHHDPPNSLQLINPNSIAHAMHCPVVFDLRAADIAAGGQGAPITPIVDAILFADAEKDVAIVNLGGFANFTRLPCVDRHDLPNQLDRIQAGDICVCNQLLDHAARTLLDQPFDRDGALALDGEPHEEAGGELVTLLIEQSRARRSLGTGDECLAWVDRWKVALPARDLLRTICACVAQTIADRVEAVDLARLAGGSAQNGALVCELESRGVPMYPLNHEAGVDSTNREAVSMAVLGALSQDRVPITLPQVTKLQHARAPIAGSWIYPPYDHEKRRTV